MPEHLNIYEHLDDIRRSMKINNKNYRYVKTVTVMVRIRHNKYKSIGK